MGLEIIQTGQVGCNRVCGWVKTHGLVLLWLAQTGVEGWANGVTRATRV